MRSMAIVLGIILCAIQAGCGSIGEPLYPALNIPTRVTDLAAVERGSHIDITFTIPPLTTEGLAVRSLGNIELRIGPNPNPPFEIRNWAASAQQVDVAIPAAPRFIRTQVPAQQFVGKNVVVAVRVANGKGRFSDWSNVVTLNVEQPLPTPSDVKAEAAPQGVRLSWTAPGATQFRIYRKTGDQKTPSLLGSSDQPNYVDSSAEFGKEYAYYIEGVHDKTVTDVAGPVSIAPQDTFPPAVPSGLTASAGVGAVELAWERNTEPDFKEYRVFRAEGDGTFTQIAAGLEAPSFSDHAIESGKRYRYRLTAVDQLNNESQPTIPVQITVP